MASGTNGRTTRARASAGGTAAAAVMRMDADFGGGWMVGEGGKKGGADPGTGACLIAMQISVAIAALISARYVCLTLDGTVQSTE